MDALNSVDARVLGTVLNMVPSGGHSYGYGYGYPSEYASRTDRPRLTTVDPPETPVAARSGHAESRAG